MQVKLPLIWSQRDSCGQLFLPHEWPHHQIRHGKSFLTIKTTPLPLGAFRREGVGKIPPLYTTVPPLRMPLSTSTSEQEEWQAKESKRTLLGWSGWSLVMVNQSKLDIIMPICYLSWCFVLCGTNDSSFRSSFLTLSSTCFLWIFPYWCHLLGRLHPVSLWDRCPDNPSVAPFQRVTSGLWITCTLT